MKNSPFSAIHAHRRCSQTTYSFVDSFLYPPFSAESRHATLFCNTFPRRLPPPGAGRTGHRASGAALLVDRHAGQGRAADGAWRGHRQHAADGRLSGRAHRRQYAGAEQELPVHRSRDRPGCATRQLRDRLRRPRRRAAPAVPAARARTGLGAAPGLQQQRRHLPDHAGPLRQRRPGQRQRARHAGKGRPQESGRTPWRRHPGRDRPPRLHRRARLHPAVADAAGREQHAGLFVPRLCGHEPLPDRSALRQQRGLRAPLERSEAARHRPDPGRGAVAHRQEPLVDEGLADAGLDQLRRQVRPDRAPPRRGAGQVRIEGRQPQLHRRLVRREHARPEPDQSAGGELPHPEQHLVDRVRRPVRPAHRHLQLFRRRLPEPSTPSA